MSSTIASSILRKFSACRCSLDENGIAPSLVTPSTTCAMSWPNTSRMRSMLVSVSSTTSCSSPAATATTSSFRSARMAATSRGCTRYGSPEWRTCPLCSKAEKTYAFRSSSTSASGEPARTFSTRSSNRIMMGGV